MPPLDPSTSDLQNPGKSTPKVQPRAPKRSHNLSNDPRPSPLSLCKFAHNFRKLTIPWSSTALDQQNPKKNSRPKKLSRTTMRHWWHRYSLPQLHALPRASLIVHALAPPSLAFTRHALTYTPRAMMSCMTSSSRLDLTRLSSRLGNLTRSELPEIILKKKKWEKKCFD